MSHRKLANAIAATVLLVPWALLAAGCSRPVGTLAYLDPAILTNLPAYDRGAVAARRAAVLTGDGDRVTVGVVGCDYPDIQAALDGAPAGVQVFYLMDPVYRVTGLRIARDVSLVGFGARDTVLEGAATPEEANGGIVRIEAGASVRLSGLTVRAGRVDERPRLGGGVSNSGTLVMEDCAIVDNLATSGVGVWTEGRLEMRRCVVAGNRGLRRPPAEEYAAVGCGGKGTGLRVEKGGYALVEDSVIAFNEAVKAGGALHVSCEAGARLVDCLLYGNYAPERGGAIDSAGGELELVRCTIAGNSSGGRGAAIFHRGRLSLVGCLFADNGPGAPYFLAADKGGEYGRGVFADNRDNFDTAGSVPLATTGSRLYVFLRAGAIRREYGASGIDP